MADSSLNPAASHHLPSFITAPGQTDVLMVVTSIILVLCVVGFGVLFLRLHTLPERMAHKSQKIQFEIVAVLGLLALFTHIHAFWVAGLLLALIDFPDFGSFMGRIAGSIEKIAGVPPDAEASSSNVNTGVQTAEAPGLALQTHTSKAEGPTVSPVKPERAPARQEANHA